MSMKIKKFARIISIFYSTFLKTLRPNFYGKNLRIRAIESIPRGTELSLGPNKDCSVVIQSCEITQLHALAHTSRGHLDNNRLAQAAGCV